MRLGLSRSTLPPTFKGLITDLKKAEALKTPEVCKTSADTISSCRLEPKSRSSEPLSRHGPQVTEEMFGADTVVMQGHGLSAREWTSKTAARERRPPPPTLCY